MFANPIGLLALLGIPVVLAIHFLQRKSITLPVSTLFLLERTQREATSGRRFERLLPSIPLWMQLLAMLLLAWFLAEPRFQKENSVQRIAIVIDTSASMMVFKDRAISTLKDEIPKLQGSASSLEITLLPCNPGADRIYAGSSTAEMITALEGYPLTSGLVDPSSSLRLARSIVSKDGIVIYLTDTPQERLPYEASLIAIGEPIPNVGFTGISFQEKDGTLTWQALIRNYQDQPTKRSWSLKSSEGSTAPKEFEIAANSFLTIQAAYPPAATNVRITLTPDKFTLDDTLPIIAPKPKNLRLFTATSPSFQSLTGRLLRSLQSTSPSSDAASSDLIISSYDPLDPTLPATNAVLFVEDPTSAGKYLKGGILAEAHPLMDGINWQALLVRETLELPRQPEDRVLLWQEKRPLIFLREKQDIQTLCFNFDLRLSNATSQPAFIVLLHRFAESIRARKISPQALNLETGQAIQIATDPALKTTTAATDPAGNPIQTPNPGTAPQTPSFLEISQQTESSLKLPGSDPKEMILTAAVHFADTREADFKNCGEQDLEITTASSSVENHTSADPLARLWILLLTSGLLVAWYFSSRRQPKISAPI